MKIGCSPAYMFAHFQENVTFTDVIGSAKRVAQLGFCCLQLETYNLKQKDIFNGDRVNKIRHLFQDLGLEISQFNVHAIRRDLVSLDKKRRNTALEELKNLVGIAAELGLVDVITIPSSPIPEMIIEYYETYPGGIQPILDMPDNISWRQIWDTHIKMVSDCLRVVSSAGMRLAIEGVPYGLISNIDSFLRLAEVINSDSLGFNLDTGHIFVQKEDLSIAIHKLGPRIFGTHVCDNDGCEDSHWIPGEGKIDWAVTLNSLKDVGYEGSLDIEVNIAEDPDKAYLEGKRFLERILNEL